MNKKNTNIVWHDSQVTKNERQKMKKQRSCVLWFTGLSGSGKSTLATEVERQLHSLGKHTYLLDGDNVRHGLNKNLGFSNEHRTENIRRIGEVSKLFVDAGVITLTAFISPFHNDRENVKKLLDENEFIEVYVRCPLSECEKRDPKGLYQKARNGEISEFTGISSPYEEPLNPNLIIDTDQFNIKESSQKVVSYLTINNYI